jgi:hypothetical protein
MHIGTGFRLGLPKSASDLIDAFVRQVGRKSWQDRGLLLSGLRISAPTNPVNEAYVAATARFFKQSMLPR